MFADVDYDVFYMTLPADVSHAADSMTFAIRGRLAALDIKRGSHRAGAMRATLAPDVDQTVLGMPLAVHRLLCALNIEVRLPTVGAGGNVRNACSWRQTCRP